MLMFRVSTSAVNCSQLTVPNASLNTSSVSYSAAVEVTCNTGYKVDPTYQISSFDVQCQTNESGYPQWSPQPSSCQGK